MIKKRKLEDGNGGEGTNVITMKDPADRLSTKLEVADFLRVTTRTIEAYMKKGLPHYRLGRRRTRFAMGAVRDWLETL